MRLPLTQLLLVLIVFGCKETSEKSVPAATSPASPDYYRGAALYAAGEKKDSAFYYFTKITLETKDSLLAAAAFNYMAIIQAEVGDNLGSQESALQGLRLLNEKNPAHRYYLSSLYNELGAAAYGLKDFDLAIDCYDRALMYQSDTNARVVLVNNKAVAYRDKGDYANSIRLLKNILVKQTPNTLDYARALTNFADVKSLANSAYNPVPEYLKALAIRKDGKDEIGMTAGYRHLADYYLKRNPAVALSYYDTMYRLARKIGSVDEQLNALPELVSLASAVESKIYFKQYIQLNDSVTSAINKAKNRYAAIRYQSERNKAENLLLNRENAEKQVKLLRQRAWILILGPLVIAVIIVSFMWMRKKKQQLMSESRAKIRENNLRTSQQVHDIVANGLYRLMKEVEHEPDLNRDDLLDKMDYLYESSRDISYQKPDDNTQSSMLIEKMLTGFATPQTLVVIAGNSEALWQHFSKAETEEIKKILQELMVNMSKHSKAQNVAIKFEEVDDAVIISYRDDGVGLGKNPVYGNGLKSTENRIVKLKGKINFTGESEHGTSIRITIPKVKR